MKKIVNAIISSSNLLICMHVDPDGDTIGSAIALSLILGEMGKKFTIYSSGPIPEIYKFLKNTDKIDFDMPSTDQYDAVIALDCGDIKRIAGGEMIKVASKILINIDHHGDNTKFGDINFTRKCSSTGELIYYLAKNLNAKIDKDIATAIYSAIITDTGSFKYDNTSAGVLRVAAELVKAGADPSSIATKIYESKTFTEVKILGKSLEKIESHFDGKVGVIVLTEAEIKETGASNDELNDIVDFLRSLKDVEIAVFMRETKDGYVKVNFRSKGPNIQKIAKIFGGGGHAKASGAVVKEDIQELKNKILNEIKKIWTQS